jgi:hypothetical protein
MSIRYDEEPQNDAWMREHVANLAYELERVLERHQSSECGCGCDDLAVKEFLVNLALGQPNDPDRDEVLRYVDQLLRDVRRLIIETWTGGGPE